jgi:hypothetical protein
MTGCFFLRAEAGSHPGGRGTFLCFAKEKYPKERRPNCLRPLRGKLRRCVCGLRRGTRYALRAALGQPRRVSSRSMRVLRHACHPANTPPQAQPDGSLFRAFASLGHQGRARSATSGMGRAQRRPETTPSVCAWGAQGAGWRVCRRTHPHQHLACRSCLSVARSAQRVLRHAPRTSTPGCPAAQRRGRRQQGRLLFAYFLLAKQEKVSRPPGRDPASAPRGGGQR